MPALCALLAAGASPSRPDALGNTALSIAAALGLCDAVTLLLRHGADPDVASGAQHELPLQIAVHLWYVSIQEAGCRQGLGLPELFPGEHDDGAAAVLRSEGVKQAPGGCGEVPEIETRRKSPPLQIESVDMVSPDGNAGAPQERGFDVNCSPGRGAPTFAVVSARDDDDSSPKAQWRDDIGASPLGSGDNDDVTPLGSRDSSPLRDGEDDELDTTDSLAAGARRILGTYSDSASDTSSEPWSPPRRHIFQPLFPLTSPRSIDSPFNSIDYGSRRTVRDESLLAPQLRCEMAVLRAAAGSGSDNASFGDLDDGDEGVSPQDVARGEAAKAPWWAFPCLRLCGGGGGGSRRSCWRGGCDGGASSSQSSGSAQRGLMGKGGSGKSGGKGGAQAQNGKRRIVAVRAPQSPRRGCVWAPCWSAGPDPVEPAPSLAQRPNGALLQGSPWHS
jgi:hypothetical protein